jgi:hypothetical protein
MLNMLGAQNVFPVSYQFLLMSLRSSVDHHSWSQCHISSFVTIDYIVVEPIRWHFQVTGYRELHLVIVRVMTHIQSGQGDIKAPPGVANMNDAAGVFISDGNGRPFV